MIIDLKSIFVNENSSLPIEYSLDLSFVEHSGVFPLKKPVCVSGSISNRASLVLLDAIITYEFDAPCDRCGADTVHKHSLSVKKALAVSLEGEESEDILAVPEMKLDLDELVYTEIVVDLPMKHLCREDCRGICPECGKNLNSGDCGCVKKEIDPRLSALAELLEN